MRNFILKLQDIPLISLVLFLFIFSPSSFAQISSESTDALLQRAAQEYAARKFADAERDFRQVTKRDSSNVEGQMYLGHTLFRQEKYAESVVPYEKAYDLENHGTKLNIEQHRILIDQLAISYGITGDQQKAESLLERAVRDDPEYPLNYYNLACLYAEKGEKGKVLTNLDLAFQRKEHMLKGEQLPDPRKDTSFQGLLEDQDFIRLMSKLGFK